VVFLISFFNKSAGSHSFNFTGLAPGNHALRVYVSNTNGQSNDGITYTVNQPDPPTVNITSPASNTSGASKSLTINYATNQFGYTTWYHNNIPINISGGVSQGTPTGAGSHSKTFSNLSTGLHTFKVVLSNSNGEAQKTIRYSVTQSDSPTIIIDSPASGIQRPTET